MPAPWKHPDLGTYYFRKVVPKALREAVGKTEIRIPLTTNEARAAKLAFPAAAAEADAILAKARASLGQSDSKPISLTHKDIVALAGYWFTTKLAWHEVEPDERQDWNVLLDAL